MSKQKAKVKYFSEEAEGDKLWDDNKHRMIYFESHITFKKALDCLNYEIKHRLDAGPSGLKDILAVRYPSSRFMKGDFFSSMINGTQWIPSEIWLYN